MPVAVLVHEDDVSKHQLHLFLQQQQSNSAAKNKLRKIKIINTDLFITSILEKIYHNFDIFIQKHSNMS